MVVGRSDFSLRAASDALPMRDAFAVLFFVSVGMLFDPACLLRAPGAGRGDARDRAGRQAAGRAGDRAGAAAIRCASALAVAVALAQIGEFSFILATLGRELEMLPAGGHQRAGRGGDRLDLAQPAALPADRPDRAVAASAAARLAAGSAGADSAPAAAAAGRWSDGRAPGGRRRLRPGRPDARPPAARERHRADGHRDEPGDGPRGCATRASQAVYGDATTRETLTAAGVARRPA